MLILKYNNNNIFFRFNKKGITLSPGGEMYRGFSI